MSTAPVAPSTSTSQSNFVSIFNASLELYKRKTKNDLVSHPLLPSLQSCNSAEAVLTVLRDHVSAFDQSQDGDDGLTKWVTPTVNVLYSFSGTIGQGVGLAFPPASIIFAGIDVLISAAKNASASQDKLIDIFDRVEHFFRRLEIYTTIPPTRSMSDMIVEIMVEVLTILGIATKEAKRGRIEKYFRKLTGNKEMEDSMERLDKLTLEEARMASAEQLKMTRGVDDRVRGVGGQVQDVRDDVQDVRGGVQVVGSKVQDVNDRVQDVGNKVQDVVRGVDGKLDQFNRNQLKDSLLRWLSPPNPSINHNIACKAHHNGTTQWFFQGTIFNRWKTTGSFLWIHGKPGSGKTVVCSSIIQDIMVLRDSGTASVAYFYFDFRDVDKQKLCNVLPSLLVQLSARSDAYCDILSQLYSAHDQGVQKPSDRAMAECLKQMLTLEEQRPTYIILDALDECPVTSSIPSPREEVLELLEDLAGLHLPNLHICVTSRPEADIRIGLERLTERPVSLHDESGQKEDIADYVSSSVRSDRRMGRWREEDKELVIKTLSEKAEGMFRWVFCQLELLRQCFPSSVQHILEELPNSLDETYERILREIGKPNQGHAHRLLQCLVVAVRPLKVQELVEVLAFDFNTGGMPKLNPGWRWDDQEEAVMSVCSSLVTIVKDGDFQIAQFSHFSVKEFLTADRLAEPIRDVTRYHIRLEAAHTILAQACLGVLLRLDDGVDRDNIEGFPLALYAAQYWPKHARGENVSPCIKDGMECLFDAEKRHFSTWLWIHNEERDTSMATVSPEKPEAVPLYYAAMLGFCDLAEHIISKHPEHVNARGGREETPMHAAAATGHTNILSLLTEHGAGINDRGINGNTPLLRASYHGKLEAGQFLLDHGADISTRNGLDVTALICATFDGHVEFARMLLERGALMDVRGYNGWTALHYAMMENRRIQVARLLLEHGADINVRDEDGCTPLEVGLRYGSDEVVQVLSAYGAESVKQ